MLIYNIPNVNKVHQAVTTNLRALGVKSRVKRSNVKSENNTADNLNRVRKIFGAPLSHQKFDSVKLSNGAVVSVPVFVKQAVSYLDLHLNQEGLFRKAGSQTRQKELVARFDNANELTDKYNPIDVANCLKKYLRDLPEAIIPNEFHDVFVRSGLLKFCKIEAILMASLLLPPKNLATLAYLMDFFQRVAAYESLNKMSIDNLSKVIGPNIMPVRETSMAAVQNRLNAHLAIVKILIENARKIGLLPKEILETIMSDSNTSPGVDLNHSGSSSKQKKKKHRSGSLTRMFNGLKKMVSKNGSPENNETTARRSVLSDATPLSPGKSTKKRKNSDPPAATTITSKKKRHSASRTLFSSPISDDPNPTEVKSLLKADKSRRLGLNFDRFVSKSRPKITELEVEPEKPSPLIERRWSMASGAARHVKKRNIKKTSASSLIGSRVKQTLTEEYDGIFMEADVNLSDSEMSPVPLKNRRSSANRHTIETVDSDEEYVKIPKSEYEEIKHLVSAMESRIDRELEPIENSYCVDSASQVQSKYEKVLGEASIESITPADQLARRLSKELKIRKPSERKVIRSPSARKIGTIRRRSQEKPTNKRRISRAASWHISDQHEQKQQKQQKQQQQQLATQSESVCSEETNARLDFLRRQLNTLISHTAEHTQPTISYCTVEESHQTTLRHVRRASSFHGNEMEQKAPYYNTRMANLKKTNSQKNVLPSTNEHTMETESLTWKNASIYLDSERHTAKSLFLRKNISPGMIGQTGRDSIAKLRTQNAGMVLAKAKLFDHDCKNQQDSIQRVRKSSVHSASRDIKVAETPPPPPPPKVERKKNCKSPKNQHEIRFKVANGGHPSLTCDQENSVNNEIVNEDNATHKTPHIKKPLATKTPKSARSLVRRAPLEMSRTRTPLKAVPLVGTPKRHSPRNTFKARQVTRTINID
uniref:Rho-GAP domain-containing protein n=1 Tax=Bracon brevicornis TaxID=1563983 RepID=A0A6V7INB2_9HYME